MIGKLKGKLTEIDGNIGLVETVGGVYYQLYLNPAIINSYRLNDDIEVYTYLQVREDALILFGFKTKTQHDFFKMLLTVPGVGPKTAYNIISFGKVEEVMNAVKLNDLAFFSKIPGLGKKTSLKIMLELSQKLKQEFKLEGLLLTEEDKIVIDALVSLGFKTYEAEKILAKIPKNLSLEDRIKKGIMLATNTSNNFKK
jgi:Holliday junction DNA helicase RuvA